MATTIEELLSGIPDLDAAEFAPIRSRLARLYLAHKADIGVPAASDESIVSHVDDIAALLLRGVACACNAQRRVLGPVSLVRGSDDGPNSR